MAATVLAAAFPPAKTDRDGNWRNSKSRFRDGSTVTIPGCGAAPGSAAALCANYSLNGIRGWFLPSTDELKQMYVNLKLTGVGDFGDSSVVDNYSYWSSTQRTADMADHLDFADNGRRQHYDDKDYPRRVRAVRTF